MDNPYTKMIEIMRAAGEQSFSAFRVGRVKSSSPLIVAVSGNACMEEIRGMAGDYTPKAGDEVLLANVDNSDNDYIIICKVVR